MASEQDAICDLAKDMVGNWQKVDTFVWFDKPEDANNWAIIETHSWDSGLLDISNAAVVDKAMGPYCDDESPDAKIFKASHWACGWTKGYAIRVYNIAGDITEAFKAYARLAIMIDYYPVLDELDYSERQYKATLENIRNEGHRLFLEVEEPDDWPERVFNYYWESDEQDKLEDGDDQGGWLSREDIETALGDLGIPYDTEEDE